MAGFAFGGHDFEIAGKTGLFWPARRALIVADLHLEKASWFAMRGQMLPPYDSQATLESLERLIAQTSAREVWCLGDNFHDAAGPERLPPATRALLARLTATMDWHWITGNHDAQLPDGIGGSIRTEALVDGLLLRHEAAPDEWRAELSGHFHPKIRAAARGHGVTRACFVRGERKLILPSFGAFTGGMSAGDPAILQRTGRAATAIVEVGGKALMLPLGTL